MTAFPQGTSFLFVGKLESMSRDQARSLVMAKGGRCPSAPSADLDYLVVGNEQSPFYGGDKKPKQIKAESLIDAGASTAIITENDFISMIDLESQPTEKLEDFGSPPA
jgi:BRCT domain type II-containing protein